MIVGTDRHTLASALEKLGITIDTTHKSINTASITIGSLVDGGITFYFDNGDKYMHYEVHGDGSAWAEGHAEGWQAGFEAGREDE